MAHKYMAPKDGLECLTTPPPFPISKFWIRPSYTHTGLGAMGIQFGCFARLTWFEYSWDIMEPVTYFATYGTLILFYCYFLLTRQEYTYPDTQERIQLFRLHKAAKKKSFDIEK